MTEVDDQSAEELSKLRVELAVAKAEILRIREQLTLDVAEAKVDTGRAVRQLNDVTRKLRETEAQRQAAVVVIQNYQDARERTVEILNRVLASMTPEASEA